MSYNNKTMNDQIPSDADLERGFASIPGIPQNKKIPPVYSLQTHLPNGYL